MALFTGAQLEAIADALGETREGLTGSEIAFLLTAARIADRDPSLLTPSASNFEIVVGPCRSRSLGLWAHGQKPKDVWPESTDDRDLGVMVHSLRIEMLPASQDPASQD